MEVSTNMNQFYSTSIRLFSNAISTQQQLDSKLIAFCTILTVALSVLLSFKQSRCLLINATTTYPITNVKRCIKCLRSLKVVNKSYKIITISNNYCYNGLSIIRRAYRRTYISNTGVSTISASSSPSSSSSSCTTNSSEVILNNNNFKLKRLRNNIVYIARKLNNNLIVNTFLKMKRQQILLSGSDRSNTTNSSNNNNNNNNNGANFYSSKKNIISPSVDGLTNSNYRSYFRFHAKRQNHVDASACDFCENCENEQINYDNNNYTTSSNVGRGSPFLPASATCPAFTSTDNNNPQTNKRVSSMSNLNQDSTYSMPRSKSLPRINSKVRLYKKLPLRSMSRAWGEINSIDLPVWCRKPCFYLYSWLFKCNLSEIDIDDLNQYKNLSEFFRRKLKPNIRVIDQTSCLISPCDGTILHFGRVENGYLEQVKGVNYSLKAFLGEQNWPKNQINASSTSMLDNNSDLHDQDENYIYEKNILYNPENCLYHCVIYLAPGDYHRFHSPADWEIFYRRHFPGELFSVNPSVARWLQGLFNYNERVVYYGEWKYGFFSMTPVGATNVGSIRVYMDQELTTNNKIPKSREPDEKSDKSFSKVTTRFSASAEDDDNREEIQGVSIKRAENFGEFNLGSTIVLIFEAPPSFEFNISQNQKVLYGKQLGSNVTSTYL